jgi:hypothetical protein
VSGERWIVASVAGRCKPLLSGEEPWVEDTSGAVEFVFFREKMEEAALRRTARKCGEPGELIPLEAVTARPLSVTSSEFHLASAGDKGCASQSGWGKSTAVSGHRGGG